MQPLQLKAYSATLRAYIEDLTSVDDYTFRKRIASFMAQRLALLQICSNPKAVLEDYSETPAKLIALDSILKHLIVAKKEKVVLWSYFRCSIDTLASRYKKFNPVRVDGSVKDPEVRRDAVTKFQEDDRTMLFVANPAAAGAGITLHRSRYAIYESMSNQAAHYLQSLDRIHRRGQTRPVEYIILLCDQSIELREYERLITKERSAQLLLGDAVTDPISRESLLGEARLAAEMLGTKDTSPNVEASSNANF